MCAVLCDHHGARAALLGRVRQRIEGHCHRLSDLALILVLSPSPHACRPTSGLDSLSALVVMKQLKRYCDRGVTIMCTIHQPRFAIWALFEKVRRMQSYIYFIHTCISMYNHNFYYILFLLYVCAIYIHTYIYI
jgi:archaellum biogenesis ATPase FlaH